MDDFTNQIQIEEITGTPTESDLAEYHEWLDSLKGEYDPQDDCTESEWQELYGTYDYDCDFYDCD